uniref:Uncharacterized protein TCIL3000_11_2050 n=1 Tax=Trypanosoma congolense (strain IL3000) TaxID=1068625 RepID=G0UZJ8_TRYCI|nr:unnamed protein product [Trypanosoma congolense IL3000]
MCLTRARQQHHGGGGKKNGGDATIKYTKPHYCFPYPFSHAMRRPTVGFLKPTQPLIGLEELSQTQGVPAPNTHNSRSSTVRFLIIFFLHTALPVLLIFHTPFVRVHTHSLAQSTTVVKKPSASEVNEADKRRKKKGENKINISRRHTQVDFPP